MGHELYRVANLPVSQNRTFADAAAARASASADIVLVQDAVSGLIFNRAFNADKLSYDSDYQNEQAHSVSSKNTLSISKESTELRVDAIAAAGSASFRGLFSETEQ